MKHPLMRQGLTEKQALFVEAYLGEANFNGVEAVRMAGYSGDYQTLGAIASENLRKPKLLALVVEAWEKRGMSVEEIIGRFSDISRGSLEWFLTFDSQGGWHIDLEKARRAGKLHLLKSIKHNKFGPEITLHDPIAALERMAKIRKLYNDSQIDVDVHILNIIMEALPIEHRAQFRASVAAALPARGDREVRFEDDAEAEGDPG